MDLIVQLTIILEDATVTTQPALFVAIGILHQALLPALLVLQAVLVQILIMEKFI